MAAVIQGGDILEVAYTCLQESQTSYNIRHYQAQSVVGTPTTADAATHFDNIHSGLWKGLLCAAATWYGVKVQRIEPRPPTFPDRSVAHTGPGLVAGDPLPKQVCGVLTFLTALAGRGYRGRIYIPFPSEASNTALNKCEPSYVTNLTNLGIALKNSTTVSAAGNSVVLFPVLWHRETRTATPINDYRSNPIWGTQRRRGDYGRTNPPSF